MKVSPVSFHKASDEIKNNYLEIINALGLPYLPLFFQYFGSFPEYLNYITKQIVANLNNEKFNLSVKESAHELKKLFQENFSKTSSTIEFLNRYQTTPQFYNFRDSLEKIFIINFKMTLIFLALREAIKGWAIGAKKISSHASKESQKKEEVFEKMERMCIQEDQSNILEFLISNSPIVKKNSKALLTQKKPKNDLEVNFFLNYLKICQKEFFLLTKQEKYFLFRVQIEKFIINFLSFMPEIIFSPINVILPLISSYDNYPDFLYLLYEYFPPLSVQKFIFSGYLLF